MAEVAITYEKLSKSEAKRLHSLLREKHGNVRKAHEATEVSINTLKRAALGLEILPEKATAIREKLLSTGLQSA